MEQTITFERVERPGMDILVGALAGCRSSDKSGWVADVRFDDGSRKMVSKRDTDGVWIVDGEWPPNQSWPRFWNGSLSRCTRLVVADAALVAAIEDELFFAEWNDVLAEVEGQS